MGYWKQVKKVYARARLSFRGFVALAILMDINGVLDVMISWVTQRKAGELGDAPDRYFLGLDSRTRRYNYQSRGLGSLASVVLKDFEVDDPVLRRLASLMDAYNRRELGGKVGDIWATVEGRDFLPELSDFDLWAHVQFVVGAWIEARDVEAAVGEKLARTRGLKLMTPGLEKAFGRAAGKAGILEFSLAQFIRDGLKVAADRMGQGEELGPYALDNLLAEARWWEGTIAGAKSLRNHFLEEAKTLRGEEVFRGERSGLPGIFVQAENPMALNAFFRKGFAAVVIRKPATGQALMGGWVIAVNAHRFNGDPGAPSRVVERIQSELMSLDPPREGMTFWGRKGLGLYSGTASGLSEPSGLPVRAILQVVAKAL